MAGVCEQHAHHRADLGAPGVHLGRGPAGPAGPRRGRELALEATLRRGPQGQVHHQGRRRRRVLGLHKVINVLVITYV